MNVSILSATFYIALSCIAIEVPLITMGFSALNEMNAQNQSVEPITADDKKEVA